MALRAPTRSPIARSAGVFAAACVISLLVSLLTTFLGLIQFGPLQSLIAADNRVFYALATPPLVPAGPVRPVVFVDINDATVARETLEPSGRTPRPLLAQILNRVRKEGPAVILLDFDLRDSSARDGELLTELGRPRQPPILIPYFFDSALMPACKSQNRLPGPLRPQLTNSPFDPAFNTGSLYKAHAVLESGAYGLIEGTCSGYRLSGATADAWTDVPAAMVLASRLTHVGAGVADWPPRPLTASWRLREKKDVLIFNKKAAYVWIPAGKLLFWHGVDLSALKGAIVIIGATHHGAEDWHPTPVGAMPGALIHANIALQIQYPAPGAGGWRGVVLSFVIDFLFTLLAAALATAICWHPLHRKLGDRRDPSIGQRLSRLAGELIVVWSVWLAMSLLVVVLASYASGVVDVWRFGLLASLCGTIIVFLIEFVAVLSDSASRAVERMVQSRLPPR